MVKIKIKNISNGKVIDAHYSHRDRSYEFGMCKCYLDHSCVKCLYIDYDDRDFKESYAENHNIKRIDVDEDVKRKISNGEYEIIFPEDVVEEARKMFPKENEERRLFNEN